MKFLVCRDKKPIFAVPLEPFKGELSIDVADGKAAVVWFKTFVDNKQVALVYSFVYH